MSGLVFDIACGLAAIVGVVFFFAWGLVKAIPPDNAQSHQQPPDPWFDYW